VPDRGQGARTPAGTEPGDVFGGLRARDPPQSTSVRALAEHRSRHCGSAAGDPRKASGIRGARTRPTPGCSISANSGLAVVQLGILVHKLLEGLEDALAGLLSVGEKRSVTSAGGALRKPRAQDCVDRFPRLVAAPFRMLRSTSSIGPIIAITSRLSPVASPSERHCRFEMATTMTSRPSSEVWKLCP
jgi:hypothetical protein